MTSDASSECGDDGKKSYSSAVSEFIDADVSVDSCETWVSRLGTAGMVMGLELEALNWRSRVEEEEDGFDIVEAGGVPVSALALV